MKVIGNLEVMGQRSIIQMNSSPASNQECSGWISEEFVDENVLLVKCYFSIWIPNVGNWPMQVHLQQCRPGQ